MKAEISILSVPAVHAAETGRECLSLWHPSHLILPFLLFSSISFFRSHFPPFVFLLFPFLPFFFFFVLTLFFFYFFSSSLSPLSSVPFFLPPSPLLASLPLLFLFSFILLLISLFPDSLPSLSLFCDLFLSS